MYASSSTRTTTAPAAAATTRSADAPRPSAQPYRPKDMAPEADAPSLGAARPVALHPLGAAFVRWGHAITQVSARCVAFFEGLVGLSAPHLRHSCREATLTQYAERLFEIRQLAGKAQASAGGPEATDFVRASDMLHEQQGARHIGAQLHAAMRGIAAWCKAWFVVGTSC